jgi:hypothetical protein
MELKTQGLDRVLEALSPALAAELDRVVEETRQALEQEFQKRLQTAVRETELAAEVRMARSVAEIKEATQQEVTAELEEKYRIQFAEATAQLKGEASAERTRLQEQADQWRVFAETQRQLAEASSQPEILARFLKIAQPYAAGLGLYIAKADGLALWKHKGTGAFPEIISQETTDPETYFRAIVVRAKAVAAVSAMPPFSAGALDFLSASLERAIEVFGLKLKGPVPKPSEAAEAGRPSSAKSETAPEPTASGKEPDDQRAHADARRIARLLVSEIKLFHEQELREGREHSDIYDRLHREIDLGREAYTHRVPRFILAGHDYFHEEVVRILCENDLSRMGRGYPGPVIP